YSTPTPIQEQAIPVILKGRDVLGIAQTGTGKTGAFILPILQHLLTNKKHRVRVLILAPTRELAEQTRVASTQLGKHTGIHSISIYGGVSKGPQVKALREGAEIVVACPGRLLDLHSEGQIDLSNVEILVLDEADRMCDMGFLPDIRRILKLLPSQMQTLFFSATMPNDIRDLSNRILKNPVTVQIGMIAPAKSVSHALYPVTRARKKALLMAWLEQTATGRVLVFTRTKYRARNLARDLVKGKYRAGALQGNMSQNQRQKALNDFRNGKVDILVATDIAARGIDVTEITHVINFDMPDTVDAYTHRIGRTGRVDESGDALTFVEPDDSSMVRDIEKLLRTSIERRHLPGFDYTYHKPEQRERPQSQGNPRRQAKGKRPFPSTMQAQSPNKSAQFKQASHRRTSSNH
ncbi:MAG: DEAD/DEAH box helicase, partial [Anaerolineae bacterium]|nr:DEAD/DEAH box helicase [Anaerolineae bacterium]